MAIPSGSLGHLREALASADFPDYYRDFSAQVEFFKKLAQGSWYGAPESEKPRQAGNLAKFRELKRILDAEILDFTKEDFRKPGNGFYERVNSLLIFLYLYEKIPELQRAVIEKNRVGLYALYDSLQDAVFRLLSGNFFRRPFGEALREYLGIEPMLAACAELAGVDVVPVQQAVVPYQPRLADLVIAAVGGQNDAAAGKKGASDPPGNNKGKRKKS